MDQRFAKNITIRCKIAWQQKCKMMRFLRIYHQASTKRKYALIFCVLFTGVFYYAFCDFNQNSAYSRTIAMNVRLEMNLQTMLTIFSGGTQPAIVPE
jgi:hypothetical protein